MLVRIITVINLGTGVNLMCSLVYLLLGEAVMADIIPSQLVEEALGALGEVVDKKVGGKWWVKPLYWISIVVVLSIPVLYYFW